MHSLTHPKKMHGKFGGRLGKLRPLTNQGLSKGLNPTENETMGLFTHE